MESWDAILKELRRRLSRERFDIYFGSVRCAHLDAQRAVLEFPNPFVRDWVLEHFVEDVEASVRSSMGAGCEVMCVVRGEPVPAPSQGMLLFESAAAASAVSAAGSSASATVEQLGSSPSGSPARIEVGLSRSERASLLAEANLSPQHTLDAFVVGPSNQFAHAAAVAVAERPGDAYNPLFIYGGVGLGKTHLMQAVGLSVIERYGKRVAYRTSEQFMNELISGIERKEMPAFRERYRSQCDVLLIDDVQFMVGKERTQEEFFHTFNALYNSRKQIILTCDRTPQEIVGLEERLASRFAWGLMADIQRPEMETRIAIFRKKASQHGMALPDEVALYLANHVDSNIRELEGCLMRMAAEVRLNRGEASIELARKIIEPMLAQRSVSLSPERIIKLVAGYFNLKTADIKGKSRARRVAYPRALAMFLARTHSPQSYPELGRAFAKDHSTVISAVQKIEALVVTDPTVKGDVEALERNLLP